MKLSLNWAKLSEEFNNVCVFFDFYANVGEIRHSRALGEYERSINTTCQQILGNSSVPVAFVPKYVDGRSNKNENGRLWKCYNQVQEVAILPDVRPFVRLIFLALGGYLSVLVGDIIGLFTKKFLNKPKQPNRDHHFGHVLTVFVLGGYLITKKEEKAGKTLKKINEKFLKKVKKSTLGKIFENVIKKEDWERAIKLAWLIAALTHDSSYPLEMGRWLSSTMDLELWFKDIERDIDPPHFSPKNNYEKLFAAGLSNLENQGELGNKLCDYLNNIKEKLTRYFNKKFEEEKDEKDGSLPQSSSPPLDHSEEMATMLLYYISQPKVFNQLNNKGKLSAFLAIEAVALHSMLADTKKNEKIDEWAKTYPFGLFLSSMDHLAEANRLHWSLLDAYHPLENCELKYPFKKNWDIEDVEQQEWERKILLGQIVGLWGIDVEWENDSIVVLHYSGLNKYDSYGLNIANEEKLYSPSKAINKKEKLPYLKKSLQSLLGLELRDYDVDGGKNP